MDHLPWLVVHGALIWKLVLGGWIALALLLMYAVATYRARRQQTKCLAALGAPLADSSSLADGTAVVLEAGWKQPRALERRGAGGDPVTASSAAPQLAGLRCLQLLVGIEESRGGARTV